MIHRGNEGRYHHLDSTTVDGRVDQYDEFWWRRMMEDGSRRLAIALGVLWPCAHKQVPQNTLTIAGKKQCRTCRRRRWMRGFKAACGRRAARIENLRMASKMRGVILACDREFVHHALHHPGDGALPFKQLVQKVAGAFGISADQIMNTKRATFDIRDARAVIFRILRDRGLSFPVIGEAMRGKDHSTIIYALKQFDAYMAQNDKMATAYFDLKDKPDKGQSNA